MNKDLNRLTNVLRNPDEVRLVKKADSAKFRCVHLALYVSFMEKIFTANTLQQVQWKKKSKMADKVVNADFKKEMHNSLNYEEYEKLHLGILI